MKIPVGHAAIGAELREVREVNSWLGYLCGSQERNTKFGHEDPEQTQAPTTRALPRGAASPSGKRLPLGPARAPLPMQGRPRFAVCRNLTR